MVQGRQLRPDGFLPDDTGRTKGHVWLYHGNRFHGFPPGHARFDEIVTFRSARTGVQTQIAAKDLYAQTEEATLLYLESGYTVRELWGHDFHDVEKYNVPIMSRVRTRTPAQ